MPLSRFGRRHKHTFGKKKEKWDGDFRKPPKPNSYYVQEKEYADGVVIRLLRMVSTKQERHGTKSVLLNT